MKLTLLSILIYLFQSYSSEGIIVSIPILQSNSTKTNNTKLSRPMSRFSYSPQLPKPLTLPPTFKKLPLPFPPTPRKLPLPPFSKPPTISLPFPPTPIQIPYPFPQPLPTPLPIPNPLPTLCKCYGCYVNNHCIECLNSVYCNKIGGDFCEK